MNNNYNDQENGEDCEVWDQPTWAENFDDDELPEWVKALPDKSAVKWNESEGFFYLTAEDYKNGMSNNFWDPPEPCSTRTDYDFGPYGKLRAVLIDGLPWCSLEDAGRVAGIPSHWITGWLAEDQTHVRGVPDQLEPDGIRDLRPQGISDDGIRLEALEKHVDKHRCEDPRVSEMLSNAIADIYGKDLVAPKSTDVRNTDLWRPVDRPKTTGQIRQETFYDSFEGECTAVQIGAQLWFRLADISECIHLEPAIVSRMAGKARILKIPNSLVYPLFDTTSEKTYIRADAVEKLHAAMPRRPNTSDPFAIRIASKHRELLRSKEFAKSVMASALHAMLGPHLDFEVWSCEMQAKNCKFLRESNFNWSYGTSDDYPIPLTLARYIAASEGTFAGKITAILLTNGGFLHSGVIDETADATLRRFQGLVPDRHGNVQIRKIWEFLNSPDSFEKWCETRLRAPREGEFAPDEPTTTINSHWCQAIWEYFNSDHYWSADMIQ